MTQKTPKKPKTPPPKWVLVKVRDTTKTRLMMAAPHMEMNVQELLDMIATSYLDGLEKLFPGITESLRDRGADVLDVKIEGPVPRKPRR